MINVLHPTLKSIKKIQETEQSYYYSHCFDMVLKKHGYISVQAVTNINSNYVIVCRNTPWHSSLKGKTLFIEGPIDPSIYSELNIDWEKRYSSKISLYDNEFRQVLNHSKITVKKIPPQGQAAADPYPFISKNPLYNKDVIHYHTFKSINGWEPILYATNQDNAAEIVAIKKDNIILCGLPILDWITYEHTFPPLKEAGYYAMAETANLPYIENKFIQIITNHFLQNNGYLIQINKWPEKYKAALSIRHDFDRPLTDEALATSLSFYSENKFKATWFWLKKTFNKSQINEVLKYNHEISLHSEHTGDNDFFKELKFFQSHNIDMEGYTSHGGKGGLGYIGETTFHKALESNLLYGEILGKDTQVPCQAVITNPDNIPEVTKLIIPRVHFSFDASVKLNHHHKDYLLQSLPHQINSGNYIVLMNHPDIHQDAFRELLKATYNSNTWYATMSEVSKWYIFSRFAKIEYFFKDSSINIAFSKPSPYNFIMKFISKGEVKSINIPKDTKSVNYNMAKKHVQYFVSSLPSYFDCIEKTIDKAFPNPKNAATSKIVNTVNLEKRVKKIVDIMQINDQDSVLELGCGYGFFALGITVLSGAKVVACDISQDYLKTAYEFFQQYPELQSKIELQQFDYTIYKKEFENSFTKIILNNTFCYIDSAKQKETIKYLYKYLKKDGKIFFYHPNPFYYKEAFNKLPFVHWMPKSLGEKIVKKYGSRSLTDLHYQSPLKLYYYLKGAGFKNFTYYPNGEKNYDLPFIISLCAPYYGMMAIK